MIIIMLFKTLTELVDFDYWLNNIINIITTIDAEVHQVFAEAIRAIGGVIAIFIMASAIFKVNWNICWKISLAFAGIPFFVLGLIVSTIIAIVVGVISLMGWGIYKVASFAGGKIFKKLRRSSTKLVDNIANAIMSGTITAMAVVAIVVII